jgi:hypothetical protein
MIFEMNGIEKESQDLNMKQADFLKALYGEA